MYTHSVYMRKHSIHFTKSRIIKGYYNLHPNETNKQKITFCISNEYIVLYANINNFIKFLENSNFYFIRKYLRKRCHNYIILINDFTNVDQSICKINKVKVTKRSLICETSNYLYETVNYDRNPKLINIICDMRAFNKIDPHNLDPHHLTYIRPLDDIISDKSIRDKLKITIVKTIDLLKNKYSDALFDTKYLKDILF